MIKPANDTDADKLLSLRDLAKVTGINSKTLTDLCITKQLKHVQIGTGKVKGKRWVRPSWWREYEERQLKAAMGPTKVNTAADELELEFIRRSAESHQTGQPKASRRRPS
jgi:hypothetical protein